MDDKQYLAPPTLAASLPRITEVTYPGVQYTGANSRRHSTLGGVADRRKEGPARTVRAPALHPPGPDAPPRWLWWTRASRPAGPVCGPHAFRESHLQSHAQQGRERPRATEGPVLQGWTRAAAAGEGMRCCGIMQTASFLQPAYPCCREDRTVQGGCDVTPACHAAAPGLARAPRCRAAAGQWLPQGTTDAGGTCA